MRPSNNIIILKVNSTVFIVYYKYSDNISACISNYISCMTSTTCTETKDRISCQQNYSKNKLAPHTLCMHIKHCQWIMLPLLLFLFPYRNVCIMKKWAVLIATVNIVLTLHLSSSLTSQVTIFILKKTGPGTSEKQLAVGILFAKIFDW